MASQIFYFSTNYSPQELNMFDCEYFAKNDIKAVICQDVKSVLAIKEKCVKAGVALLIENDISKYQSLQIDGVYFSKMLTLKEFKNIRNQNPNAQIGVNCKLSNDDGINIANAGADFIAFEGESPNLEKLVEWWFVMVTTPSVKIIKSNNTLLDISFIEEEKHADFVMLVKQC